MSSFSVRLYLLVLAAGLGAWAQDASKPGVVEGVVVNAMTKEPLRKVQVSLVPAGRGGSVGAGVVQFGGNMMGPGGGGGQFRTVTDAEGKFRIEGVTEGQYRVVGQRTGFMTASRRGGIGAGQNVITVSAGGQVTGVKVSLLPQAVLAGKVLDDEGEPVQGISVTAMQQRYSGGRRRWTTVQGQMTNDLGEFRLVNIPPGKFVVVAQAGRGMGGALVATPGQDQMSYVNTYYGGGFSPSEASPVEVKAGMDLTNLDITLRKSHVYNIRGKALDVDGQPLRQFSAMAYPRDDASMGGMGGMAMRGGRNAQADGSFIIHNVRPGSYTVIVQGFNRGRGGPGGRQMASAAVDVGNGDVDGVVIQLSEGFTVSGTVDVQGVDPKPSLSGGRVSLMPTDVDVMFGGSPPARIQEDRTWKIENVMPGKYRVTAFVNTGQQGGGLYIASITAGGQEMFGKDIDLTSGPPGPIRILYRTDVATVTGTVDTSSSEDADSLFAVLIPTDESLRAVLNTGVAQVNASGGYTFQNLRPGEYLLWVFDDYVPGVLDDPEVLQKVQQRAVKVTAKPGETASAQAKVTPWPEDTPAQQ
jgi:hypothetical protein